MQKLIPPTLALYVAVLALPLVWPGAAHGERSHMVREGQTLAAIAKQYHVTISSIAAANGMGRSSMLRPGQLLRIPERGVIYVQQGQTLSGIARKHEVSVSALAKINRLKEGTALQIGQKLVLPGYEAAQARARAARRWGVNEHPGTARFHRIWSSERTRLRLVDQRGRVRRGALAQLRHLLRPKHSRRRKAPDTRLVRMLALISDHFGGRTIDVISGYRLPGGYTNKTSRHVSGNAIDFRVRGVPLEVLRDYCRRFANVGVGFYPRSRFIHLDVRSSNAYWVDWSRPGEPPMLRRPTQDDHDHDHEMADDAEHGEGAEPADPGGSDDAEPEGAAREAAGTPNAEQTTDGEPT